MAYIKGIDQTRYGVLAAELKNRYAKGQNDYPTDLATSFALVNLYETPKNEQVQQHNGSHKGNHQRHEATKTKRSILLFKTPPTKPP